MNRIGAAISHSATATVAKCEGGRTQFANMLRGAAPAFNEEIAQMPD
ncbi:hypothetical protein [Aurantiacibacter suaedae]|nr:hypothetical protein [Aurantiacibacter suaedae]